MRHAASALTLALLLAAPVAAHAQASDPAAQTIDRFDDALLEAMKGGKALGAQGRYRKLEPAVQAAFDIPTMARVVVGPTWSATSAADQAAVIKAFGRVIVANFAHNFDDYNGEKFVISKVDTRLPDKLVRTQMTGKSGDPLALNWRMRQTPGGTWKVVDTLFGAVSQITAYRSDYAATVASGGGKAVAAKMNEQADKLLK